MLTKVDRATMAVGIEARVPFLDHRIAELGVGLAGKFTLPGGKRVLRELHERRSGRRLARRRNQVFGVPVKTWLCGSLAPALDYFFDTSRLGRYAQFSSRALGDGQRRSLLDTDAHLLWHAPAPAVWCEATPGDGPEAVRTAFGPKNGRLGGCATEAVAR